MPILRLYLLGPLEIRVDNRQLEKPPTAKSQSLLAYLALHRRRPQPREVLAGLFWGDRPERKARRSLTTALWHIRRCLPEEELLLSDVQSAQVDPDADLWLDVVEFESRVSAADMASLESAVALYRGDFMEAFYDDWVLNERYRLETLFTEALAQLMKGLEAKGHHDRALATAQRLLRHDPLREDAYRLAMRALCHLGQRNAALDQYRSCQALVRVELGAEPMAETTALYEAILKGRVEIGPGVGGLGGLEAARQPTLPPALNPLDLVLHLPLVGREAELATLEARYQAAIDGRGGLLLVRGEAGVGKTRLVEAFADRLRWQGVRVLWGRCYEFERLLPYQPVGEALKAALATLSSRDLDELPGWMLAELSRLAPGLAEAVPAPDDSGDRDRDPQRTRLFEAVARFLATLAPEAGLVLVLDDLHWATASTLQMVHYLARHLAAHRVLIIGALRPEALTARHPLTSLEMALSREGLVTPLHLDGLPLEAIEALMDKVSGSAETIQPLARRLYEETEGNPFFLTETLQALFEAGLIRQEDDIWRIEGPQVSEAALPLPTGVSEAIRDRIGRLAPETRQALQAAAVLGREFDLDLLTTTWTRDQEATLEVLDTLLRRRLIEEGSGALGRDYAFHHHKIQEVVYADIPTRHRQHLHARAARAMETSPTQEPTSVAGELAYHYLQASLMTEAVRYLLLAGDQARLAYAHQEAIGYYAQALDLQKDRGDHEQAARTLMKLGLVHHIRFDYDKARRAFAEGFARWQRAAPRILSEARPSAPHPLRLRWRKPYTLDPTFTGTYVSRMVVEQMFSGLVTTAPDLSVVPEVAERWDVSQDGCHYRFHLRSDARWSDGTPVTAHDFEFAWKRQLDPATGLRSAPLAAIKGARAFYNGENPNLDHVEVHARDATTLDIELESPVSHFLNVLTSVNAFPVPRHAVAAHGRAWIEAGRIVCNGPFCLKTWEGDAAMTLRPNPRYAGHRSGNVECVELRFPQDPTTRDLSAPLADFLQGELDILTLTDASVPEGDRIRRQLADRYVSAPWLFTVYMGFVASRPPCDDARVRRALAMAIDRDALANRVLRGMYAPGTGGFTPPGMSGHTAGLGLPYHPAAARQLLADAGYDAPDDLPALQALSVTPIDAQVPEFLQDAWQRNLGVGVTWDVADWEPFKRRLAEDPPHAYLLASFPDWPDPAHFAHIDEQVRTRWTNQAYAALLAEANRTRDQKARLELLRAAEEMLMHEAPIVPLFYGRQHLLVQPWVTHFPISPLNRWYLKDTVIEEH